MPRAQTQLSSDVSMTAAQFRSLHAAPRKRAKYKNVRTKSHDGIEHASKKQSVRWVLLRQMEREGKIRNLRREVPYQLEVNGSPVCRYVADHVYEKRVGAPGVFEWWLPIVEDVKSPITRKERLYRLKVKLMKACLGIEVQEA